MATTYTQIATTLVSSPTTSVSFSSLGSYTDLRLIMFCYCPNDIYLRFNNDGSTNYGFNYMAGYGGSIAAGRSASGSSQQIIYT